MIICLSVDTSASITSNSSPRTIVLLDFYIGPSIIFHVTLVYRYVSLPRVSVEPNRTATHGPAFSGNDKAKGDTDMPSGTVKWFNTTKGYGFIAPDTGGKDVFVHISAVERSGMTGLADNQKVEYELQEGRDGRMMASDLKAL
jgi:CspA family cold shock protein